MPRIPKAAPDHWNHAPKDDFDRVDCQSAKVFKSGKFSVLETISSTQDSDILRISGLKRFGSVKSAELRRSRIRRTNAGNRCFGLN